MEPTEEKLLTAQCLKKTVRKQQKSYKYTDYIKAQQPFLLLTEGRFPIPNALFPISSNGNWSVHIILKKSQSMKSCYFPANAQQVLLSQPMLGSVCKDVLPTHCVSSVIYNYRYQCETDYIARTNQSLETRIDQHVPS